MEVRNLLLWYLSRDISKSRITDSDLSLVIRAKLGDKNAIKSLVDNNIKLVIKFASRFKVREDIFIDLINEGCLGIMRAIKSFDPSRKIKFSSYAGIWIKHSILSYIYSNSFVRIPTRKKRIFKYIESKLKNWDLRFSADEIINNSGISLDEYKNISSSYAVAYFSDLSDVCFESIPGNDNVEDVITKDSVVEVIRDKLSKLSPKEQFILEHRYGINGKSVMSLSEIAKIFDSTPEGIRYIERLALGKLKRMLENENIL